MQDASIVPSVTIACIMYDAICLISDMYTYMFYEHRHTTTINTSKYDGFVVKSYKRNHNKQYNIQCISIYFDNKVVHISS
jgi:hypothetical protein